MNTWAIGAEQIATAVIRVTEALGVRGGPTILRGLSALGLARDSISDVVLPYGKRIRFPTFDHYWARYLFANVEYEPDVSYILECLSRIPGKLFVDCGANIGYWTVRMSVPSYNFTDFIAVEPNPAMIAILEQNIAINGIVADLAPAAVAQRSGEVTYMRVTRHHATANIADHGLAVNTITIEELVRPFNVRNRTTVIKLDVEGSEIAAIQGAPKINEWNPIYIYEDWPLHSMGTTKFMLDSGYAVLGVAPRLQPVQISSVDDALAFHQKTAPANGPSNLVGCTKDNVSELTGFFCTLP